MCKKAHPVVLPVATTASVTPPPGTDSTGCQDGACGVAADAAWVPDSTAAAIAPPVLRTMETRKSFCFMTVIAPNLGLIRLTIIVTSPGKKGGILPKRLLSSWPEAFFGQARTVSHMRAGR